LDASNLFLREENKVKLIKHKREPDTTNGTEKKWKKRRKPQGMEEIKGDLDGTDYSL